MNGLPAVPAGGGAVSGDFALGIFQSTPEGRFLEVNQAFARLFGYASPEDLLASVGDIQRQIYLDVEMRPEIMAALRGQDAMGWFESDFRRKDGQVFTAHLGMKAVKNSAGEIARLDGFVADVTVFLLQEKTVHELVERLTSENERLRSTIKDQWRLGELVGRSRGMQEVYGQILQAAASRANVVIYGESGTGKELVARAIHGLSDRAGKQFVPVNCGAIPSSLLEREFFGHRRGAFTSAVADSPGYLDLADGGTLFLDEVGELGLDLQVKLLRAIEGGGYSPVGDSKPRRSDFRLIAATNRDLSALARTGRMREDFFFRVQVLPISLPPLRERKEDIPLLVEHWLSRLAEGGPPTILPERVMAALYRYDWPGNVRELQNVLQRYLTIKRLDFLPLGGEGAAPLAPIRVVGEGETLAQRLAQQERAIIAETLQRLHWHRGQAAQALGVDRKTLYNKMREHGLLAPENR